MTFVLASGAPIEKLAAYRHRMGWGVPWVSTARTTFNVDLGFSHAEEDGREVVEQMIGSAGIPPIVEHNARLAGTDAAGYMTESPGFSSFVLEDGVVYHTYSTTWRGLEFLMGYYPILDHAPKGRDEGAATGSSGSAATTSTDQAPVALTPSVQAASVDNDAEHAQERCFRKAPWAGAALHRNVRRWCVSGGDRCGLGESPTRTCLYRSGPPSPAESPQPPIGGAAMRHDDRARWAGLRTGAAAALLAGLTLLSGPGAASAAAA